MRRRNFPAPDEFPFTTVTGAVYDTGDYEVTDTALELVGYEEWRSSAQPAPGSRCFLLGIGIGCYVETSGNGADPAVSVEDDGTVVVTSGSVPTVKDTRPCAQMPAPRSRVARVSASRVPDTSRVDHGTGTFGSRSRSCGSAAERPTFSQAHVGG